MNRIVKLAAWGEIPLQDLIEAEPLIGMARLALEGTEAFLQKTKIPEGHKEVECYHYIDTFYEYESWGTYDVYGFFNCYTSWGGYRKVGSCNMHDPKDAFKILAFAPESELARNLKRFLKRQLV